MLLKISPCILLLIIPPLVASDDNPVVSVKLGQIRGVTKTVGDKSVHQFLGVPYAEPPVEELRFKRPVPLTQKYEATRDGTKYPATCHQPEQMLPLMELQNVELSEDCLYLNVFTSKLPEGDEESLKPVFVWIHGGGYSVGSSTQAGYEGSALSTLGDVVVVTVNYRLGTFGFLYTGDGENDAPGNMGLWDQAMALEWVQENIRYFGGDPKRVTIAGESAGGMSVYNNLISPVSKNLFHAAIPMSGASITPSFYESKADALVKSENLAKIIQCLKDGQIDMSCMRNSDAKMITLLAMSKDIQPEDDERVMNMFKLVPIYGDQFLPVNPAVLMKDDVPNENKRILSGCTDFEGGVVTLMPEKFDDPAMKKLLQSEDLDDWKKLLSHFVSVEMRLTQDESDVGKIVQTYLRDANSLKERRKAFYDLFGDFYLACPPFIEAEKYSSNNPVHTYVYTFRAQSKGAPGSLMTVNCPTEEYGVCHAGELQFLFGMPLLYPDKYTQDEKDAATQLISIMSDFVKGANLSWPEYKPRDDGTRVTLEIGGKINLLVTDFQKERCDLLRSHIL